jgi:hypothetical protein
MASIKIIVAFPMKQQQLDISIKFTKFSARRQTLMLLSEELKKVPHFIKQKAFALK